LRHLGKKEGGVELPFLEKETITPEKKRRGGKKGRGRGKRRF